MLNTLAPTPLITLYSLLATDLTDGAKPFKEKNKWIHWYCNAKDAQGRNLLSEKAWKDTLQISSRN
jgi:hypothetical protein